MKKKILQIISSIKIIFQSLIARFKSLRLLYKILVIILIIGSVIAYKIFFGAGYPQDIKVVEVHKVSKGNLLVTTKLLGTISAKKYYVATSGYNATLEFVAEAGAKLKKGEKIAYLNVKEIMDAYNSALDAAKIAENQYNREIMLEKSKTSSKNAVEQKYIQLAAAQNNLAMAKGNLDKILFIAPFDGIVATPLFHPGSQVKDNDEIVTFYDDSELVVKFDIPSDIAKTLPAKITITINGRNIIHLLPLNISEKLIFNTSLCRF